MWPNQVLHIRQCQTSADMTSFVVLHNLIAIGLWQAGTVKQTAHL